jgi:hypothetical protein
MRDAVAAREAAERDWPKVREVAELARELAARNGFGEAVTKAMGGRS